MSPLTKALVILVMILSVLELGLFVAYSSKHTRLNDQLATKTKQLDVANALARASQAETNAAQAQQTETLAGVNARNSDLTKEIIVSRTARRASDTALSAEKARNDKTEQAIARLTAAAQQDAALREALISELNINRDQIVDLRTKGVELADANNELTSSLNSLERKVRWYAESLVESNEKIDILEKIVARVSPEDLPGATGDAVADGGTVAPPDPAIAGKITEVDSSSGTPLVAVNVGANDGVASGMQFMVHRGDQYLGKLVIENVDADVSAGRMILVRGQVQADDAIYAGSY